MAGVNQLKESWQGYPKSSEMFKRYYQAQALVAMNEDLLWDLDLVRLGRIAYELANRAWLEPHMRADYNLAKVDFEKAWEKAEERLIKRAKERLESREQPLQSMQIEILPTDSDDYVLQIALPSPTVNSPEDYELSPRPE